MKSEPSLDDLADFTPMFAIRSLETGISLSPFRKTSKRLKDQNWFLKEIVANDELKAKDMHAIDLTFGYLEFISSRGDDICLGVVRAKVLAPNFANKIC
ncbi:toxin [Campylobacter jejuni]